MSLEYQLQSFFDIDPEYDKDRYWIIETSISPVLSIGFDVQQSTQKQNRAYYIPQSGKSQWIHPNDQFYLDFLLIQNQSLQMCQEFMSEIEISLTRRPPRMIRDILNMMYFYNIQPADWYFSWIAIIGLCFDLNNFSYQFDKATNSYYKDDIEYFWNPYDVFLSQLVANDLQSSSPWIFPKLTPIESKLLPKDKILAFNLEEMRTYIINKENIKNFRAMKPPSIAKIDSYLKQNGDNIEFCDIQNIIENERIYPVEMYLAHEKASQMLLGGLRSDFKFKK